MIRPSSGSSHLAVSRAVFLSPRMSGLWSSTRTMVTPPAAPKLRWFGMMLPAPLGMKSSGPRSPTMLAWPGESIPPVAVAFPTRLFSVLRPGMLGRLGMWIDDTALANRCA